MRLVARGVALLLCCAGIAAAGPLVFQGRRLDDALRILQREGLPIVFSSEIVTPAMRVTTEPRSTSPRAQLDEILTPHGLSATPGPGGVIVVTRGHVTTAPPPVAARHAHDSARTQRPAPAAGYTDHVTVSSPEEDGPAHGASGTTLDRGALQGSGDAIETDGLAAVHAMPRVSALDDYRSDFSVRGSPYRQIGIVIDGVATPWLQHTIYGRNDLGSVSMFGSDSLDNATIQAGAYPRVYEDALGAQLELNLREGSRESTRVSGTAGGMTTAFVGEGPIGRQGRGSWIAGVRNSYRSWPPGPHSAGFGFADLHAKFVYDVSPGQQFSVTALGGQSTLDTLDELRATPLARGTDDAGLLTVGWRSTLASATVVRQRVFVVGQDLSATLSTGQAAGGVANREIGYQGEALRPLFGGVVQAGAEVSRLTGSQDIAAAIPAVALETVRAGWMTRAVYVDFSRTMARGQFEGGIRASDSTLVHDHAVSPWILGAWRLGPDWTINASAGASNQFPSLDAVLGIAGSSSLVPEHATQVDVGVEHRLSGGFKWQATLFNRFERNVLRAPDAGPRLVGGVIVDPTFPGSYRNALSGVSRGLELIVTPERPGRLSGWLSYSYALTRQHDVVTQETFWADYDRRHSFSGAGMLRIGSQTTAGVVLRAASGQPIPGYFDLRNGVLVVGDQLNTVRLPAYVRLDGRVQRRIFSSQHQIALFADIVNALNRRNEGLAAGAVQPITGDALGFSQSLVPRRVSIGIQINWSR